MHLRKLLFSRTRPVLQQGLRKEAAGSPTEMRMQRAQQTESKSFAEYFAFTMLSILVPTAMYVLCADYFENWYWAWRDSRDYTAYRAVIQKEIDALDEAQK